MRKIAALVFFLLSYSAFATPHDIIVQMFGWHWKDIAKECRFLSKAGYGAIQIDPPNEAVSITPKVWWNKFQPVSYQLNKELGSEQDFKNMTQRCHQYGIKVYPDTVLNHMARSASGSLMHGTNNTTFKTYYYPQLNKDGDIFSYTSFHHNPLYSPYNCGVTQYDYFHLADYVFDCNFIGLPDLNHENPYVIKVQRKYLKYLLSLGADGFRLDAAKFIPPYAFSKILNNLETKDKKPPFAYFEIIDFFITKSAVKPSMYFWLGPSINIDYRNQLMMTFHNTNKHNLKNLVARLQYDYAKNFPSKNAVVFTNNQDTQRGGLGIIFRYKKNMPADAKKRWALANLFIFSWPYGRSKLITSYQFTDFNQAAPDTAVWQKGKNTCFDKHSPWLCQHRLPAIINAVKFHNKISNAKKVCHLYVTKKTIAFARCTQHHSLGFVAINLNDKPWHKTLSTGLPAGNYCDILSRHNSYCEKTLTVNQQSKIRIDLAPLTAIAIARTQ